jgi:hypothetical protein
MNKKPWNKKEVNLYQQALKLLRHRTASTFNQPVALQEKYEVPEMQNWLKCDQILLFGLHKNGIAIQDAANADL